jgi:hypothetical protein
MAFFRVTTMKTSNLACNKNNCIKNMQQNIIFQLKINKNEVANETIVSYMIIILLLWIYIFELDSECRTVNLAELFHDFYVGARKTYEVNLSVPCSQITHYSRKKEILKSLMSFLPECYQI